MHAYIYSCAKLLLSVLLFAHTLCASALVKWYDDQGVAHFSDRLPPSASNKAREEINQHGIIIKHIRAPKTSEEIAAERDLAIKERALKKSRKKQAEKDRFLLRMFRNTQHVSDELSQKTSGINARIEQIEQNIARAEKKILTNQKKAANYEKQGTTIPKFLNDELLSYARLIDNDQASIQEFKQKIVQLQARYEQRLIRYRQLIGLSTLLKSRTNLTSSADVHRNTFICANGEQCRQAWTLAKEYLSRVALQHTRHKPNLASDIYLSTPSAQQDNEFSIVIGRHFARSNRTSILINTQCTDTQAGRALCQSTTLKNLRKGLKAYILNQLP